HGSTRGIGARSCRTSHRRGMRYRAQLLGENGRHGGHRQAPANDFERRLAPARSGPQKHRTASERRRANTAHRQAGRAARTGEGRSVTEEGVLFDSARDEPDDWEGPATAPSGDAALYLELDGWEGPLDLLL